MSEVEPFIAKKPFQSSADRTKSNEDRLKDRSEAVALNKEIAQHASRKQLTEAMNLFEKASSLGWANSHTYAAAINANIRCGSVAGAAILFDQLRKKKGLRIDVITCTTMLKGFCSEGDMLRSVQLFEEMDKSNPRVSPNIRTINTFLRGCVTTGDIENADKMIIKTQKEYSLIPDVSTWEYLVTLLCQGLLLDKALPIIGRLKGDVSMSADLGGMNVVLAKAASLLGEWKVCKKAIIAARDSINLNEKQDDVEAAQALQQYHSDIIRNNEGGDIKNDRNNRNDDSSSNKNKNENKNKNKNENENENESNVEIQDVKNEKINKLEKEATGGKRAWKSPGVEEGSFDSRAQSLEIFRKHKREELRQEIMIVETFMEKMILLQSIDISSKNIVNDKSKMIITVDEKVKECKNDTKNMDKKEITTGRVKVEKKVNHNKSFGEEKKAENIDIIIDSEKEEYKEKQNSNKKKKRKGGSDSSEKGSENVIMKTTNNIIKNKLQYLLPFYSKIFSFSTSSQNKKDHSKAIIINTCDLNNIDNKEKNDKIDSNDLASNSSNVKIVNELSQAVLTKFGLNVCLEKLDFSSSSTKKNEMNEGSCDQNLENVTKKSKIEENVLISGVENNGISDIKKIEKFLEIPTNEKNEDKEENLKKPLTRKEKRNEKNSNKKKMKKKKILIPDAKKVEKIETEKELLFKNIISQSILPNGFIDFNAVFNRKIIDSTKIQFQPISSSNSKTESNSESVENEIKINIEKLNVPDEVQEPKILKVEICSGAGEWAISQATNDKASNWVTIELRHDRVYQTFTRAIYAGTDNICVIGGDATRILPERIQTGSIDFLFINHPEPPQQIGGFESQGKHMLTLDLFGELARVLKSNGMLTIVTDNLWYGKFLMRLVANQGHPEFLVSIPPKKLLDKTNKKERNGMKSDRGGKNSKVSKSDDEVMIGGCGEWTVLEEEGGVSLYTGRPGIECGVMVDASSYFDRLWKRDQKVERYFLVLEKGHGVYSTETHGNGLRIVHEKSRGAKQELRINTSANLEERAKKGGYAEKALKAAAFLQSGGSNKKIKFED